MNLCRGVACRPVVVGEVAQEEEGKQGVVEIVRIHGPAQWVGDAPEGGAQLFLIGVGHPFNFVALVGVADGQIIFRIEQRQRLLNAFEFGEAGKVALDKIALVEFHGIPAIARILG